MLRQKPISAEQLAQVADGGYVFAIVDACVDHELVRRKAYNEMGASRAISLFHGTYMESYDAAAPYLFHVDREVLEWISANLDESRWGIFVMTKDKRETLIPHLQRFLMVALPDGRKGYFRYYDPRILRAYLPTCEPGELRSFFEAVRGFATMDETGNIVFELSDAPVSQYPQFQAHPSGLWAIRPEQLQVFGNLAREHFGKKVATHLHYFFPERYELLGEKQVLGFVHDGIQKAWQHCMTTEREICSYIDILFALGGEGESGSRYSWVAAILKDHSRSAADRLAEVRKIVAHLTWEAS